MVAAIQLSSGIGTLIALFFMLLLFLFWLVCLFLLFGDTISVGVKILWFVALTCAAPIAIPIYLLRRAHRGPTPTAAH